MNILSGLFHSRDKPQNRVGGGWSFLFGGTTSGKTVNERTAVKSASPCIPSTICSMTNQTQR